MQKQVVFIMLFFCFIIYSAIVYTAGTSQSTISPASVNAKEGKLLFQKHNCISCHQIFGLGGYLGPDLTTVMLSKRKGEAYVRAILKTETRRMPDFKLNNEEVNCLVEFLENVGASATTYRNNKGY